MSAKAPPKFTSPTKPPQISTKTRDEIKEIYHHMEKKIIKNREQMENKMDENMKRNMAEIENKMDKNMNENQNGMKKKMDENKYG